MFAVFSKWVLDDLRPSDVVAWRFAVAVPVAWAVVLVRARRGGPGPADAPRGAFLGAGAVFGLVALLAFVALDHLTAALYTVLIYSYPAMVAVGSALLGRRPPSRVWVAIGITALGIALTVPEVLRGRAEADVTGLVFTLLNAAVYAAYVLGTGHLVGDGRRRGEPQARPADGLVAAAWSVTGSLLFALGVVAVTGLRMPADEGVVAGLLGLGVVSTVVAGGTLFVGLSRLPPATAAVIATLEPVLTLVWAVLLLDETLVGWQVAGALLVIAGVVWAQRTSPVAAVEPG
jgi:drug/metabolite transporter (DMT)-like permease